MIKAIDAANYLLLKQDSDEPDISNLKLLKLLYYAQGVSLARSGEALFSEPMEAWDHGPVVPCVYHAFKCHGKTAIPIPQRVEPIPSDAQAVLDIAYAKWGEISAWALRNMSHREPPWREAYLGRGSGAVIDINEVLQTFVETLGGNFLGQDDFNQSFNNGTIVL